MEPTAWSLRRAHWLLLAVLLGVLLGVGGFTFYYAEGAAYLSTDPKACINCHIMQGEYDAWHHSSHRAVAGCVDCHLPASGLEKYLAKALNGFNHSRAFTFQDFHEPIQLTDLNRDILQANCVRCHGDLVHDQIQGAIAAKGELRCVHCHRSVGHGEMVGLGGPHRGDDE